MGKREDYLTAAQRLLGRPYIWGAKGPDAFDCSGVATWSLYKVGGPDWRADHNCARLEKELPEIKSPKAGDLCLYGVKGAASHVMVYVGDGRVLGASGGDHTTTSIEKAAARHAAVKYEQHVLYRGDFIAYRSLSAWLDVERKP